MKMNRKSNNAPTIISEIQKRILVVDGAMGTLLQSSGLPNGVSPEYWAVNNQKILIDIHKKYIIAGADIIITCTFGANRLKLSEYNLQNQIEFINSKAVEAAKIAISTTTNQIRNNNNIHRISKQDGTNNETAKIHNNIKLEENNAPKKTYNTIKSDGTNNETGKTHKTTQSIQFPVCNKSVFVAGGLGPLGVFIEPTGELSFQEAVQIFKEQITILVNNNVDLILIETLSDIQEARAALIAVKEVSNSIPVAVSLTYDENERTLSGTDPVTALLTLQDLGADIVSTNCSTGPESMLKIIKKQSQYASVFLMVEPNAGLPKVKDGNTYFDLSPENFADYVAEFVKYGINIIGGCCGTTPEHIQKLSEKVNNKNPFVPKQLYDTVLTSQYGFHFIKSAKPVSIIGERINPTGRKNLSGELKNGKFFIAKQYAVEQTEAGANILDVNAGVPGVDETVLLPQLISQIMRVSKIPLCIDSSNPQAIEKSLALYPGIALLNSISFNENTDFLISLVKKYGCSFIFLPLSGKKLSKTADERINLINKMLDILNKNGISRNKMIVDALVLTISSNINAGVEILKTIEYIKKMNLNSVIGLSNISFGLPLRELINTNLLNMAIHSGLTSAILNPNSISIQQTLKTVKLLLGNDIDAKDYINFNTQNDLIYNKKNKIVSKTLSIQSKYESNNIQQDIFNNVLNGDSDLIENNVKTALDNQIKPIKIVNNIIIPAIMEVGELYNKKVYFLPQLIRGAETSEKAFAILKPLFDKNDVMKNKVIIIATVKGDIHDIGKNIVSLILKNAGYDIIDLGKDVSNETILDQAFKNSADIIALSALMTTTMFEMKSFIELKRNNNCNIPVIIGGAATTEEYAKEIGAEGWAANAFDAVNLVKNIIKIN